MNSLIRPLIAFGCSSLTSLVMLMALGQQDSVSFPVMEAVAAGPNDVFGYRFDRLKLLRDTLFHVRESYVEPDRIDPWRMFDEALNGVERAVPEVMFHRSDRQLTCMIAGQRTQLDLRPMESLSDLEAEMLRLAGVLSTSLRPDQVPSSIENLGPYAELEFAMTNGILHTLDPHSSLLPPEASKEMDMENKGEFGGVGVTIQAHEGYLRIEYPSPGGPADRAGLEEGDVIRRISGESTLNMSLEDAVLLLRGRVGSDVVLEVFRDGEEELLSYTITRDSVKLNPVEGHLVEKDIGYVRIRSFHATVADDLRTQLKRLSEDAGGLSGVVLDLRDNPGGYLSQAIDVSDLFLKEGEIVTTRSPYQRRPEVKRAIAPLTHGDYPMVVLVNANSASASEIVAGALRNNDRAVVIGERTFGKGSVQNLHSMSYGAKLKITIAHYFTPGEKSIQSVGIPADIELVPTFIQPETSSNAHRRALLYSREDVRREASLEKHLERPEARPEEAIYEVRYVEDWSSGSSPRQRPDVALDTNLAVGVDVLRKATRPYRGEMLMAVEPLIDTYRDRHGGQVETALNDLGLNWKSGPAASSLAVSTQLTVNGENSPLRAGETQQVTLSVTNHGTEALYQLAAVPKDSEILDGTEFLFGYLPPGKTASYTQNVVVEHGYPQESAPVAFDFRDVSEDSIGRVETMVQVERNPLPSLNWSWTVEDPEDLRLGGRAKIRLTVRNEGEGHTAEAIARIRNRSGAAMDILSGTLEVGEMTAKDGSLCEVVSPGWENGVWVGSETAGERSVGARYASGCDRRLAPGESWSGVFEVLLRSDSPSYELDFELVDAEAYEYGTIQRGGFSEYYTQNERLSFDLQGVDPSFVGVRQPPQITVSREPDAISSQALVTISGRVTDDRGISHVVVYADEDKVFHEASPAELTAPSVPFTATVDLEPGVHNLHILVEDVEGFVNSTSRVVYVPDASKTAIQFMGSTKTTP